MRRWWQRVTPAARASVGLLACIVLASSAVAQEEFSPHPDATVAESLLQLTPAYAVLHNVDYNEAKQGQPAPGQVLKDLPDGGIQASDIQNCAVKCTTTPPCNLASWYGDAEVIPDGRNCWLKELEQLCQYPADLEPHDDNRYLLLQRPVECEGKTLIADPVSPAAPPDTAGTTDKQETISTPEDKEAILGNRQMDPSVPAVWMIESGASRIGMNPCMLLLLVPCLQMLMLQF